ncbi:PLP-dependent aminotransferase family protein [Chondromyces crocatus]|uniref:GntR family transcriptional regulator n=1 Tax=Chondromyces crocatus TaxID=52 RepID=A0A0K1EI75_CHOCO|nr:PLP-dependent aminotransferase family protein [Chondromyces crocatus]AKT40397.1 GntR family transcriptional regulator [Chondromyces crocatus]
MRRPWRVDLVLDSDSRVPLYQQLVQGIVRDIRRGRLVAGDPLPGSRTIATSLGVTRKVIVTAIDELVAQGWLVTDPARGTFVSTALPEHAVADARPRSKSLSTSTARPEPPRIHLGDGFPDARLAPLAPLARAMRRALLALGRSGQGYGDPRGDGSLREVLASFLNQARGLSVTPEQVLITRGSQMALTMAALTLLRSGDAVAVESPGYTPAWDAFRFADADIVPVPVDEEGLVIPALDAVLARRQIRAVYVTPHHQYPTTVSLSAARRLALLERAATHRFTVIEDDYDHEYHFEARPLLPLASTDGLARVVYVGSLSKLLAPALRVGYLVAPSRQIENAARRRAVIDRQGDIVLERAVAELLQDGELQRHARKARAIYRQRRDAMIARFHADPRLADVITVHSPPGGLALWLRIAEGIDLEAWRQAASDRGLLFTPGRHHTLGPHLQAFRAGFAALDEQEQATALRLLALSLPPRTR